MQGVTITISGTNCPSVLSCGLYKDNYLISNPNINIYFNGTYVFVYNTTGNENYSAKSVSNNLIIGEMITTTTGLATCRYCKYGYYNLKIPFFRKDNCICPTKYTYGYRTQ
jgi:hypothetical protein